MNLNSIKSRGDSRIARTWRELEDYDRVLAINIGSTRVRSHVCEIGKIYRAINRERSTNHEDGPESKSGVISPDPSAVPFLTQSAFISRDPDLCQQ